MFVTEWWGRVHRQDTRVEAMSGDGWGLYGRAWPSFYRKTARAGERMWSFAILEFVVSFAPAPWTFSPRASSWAACRSFCPLELFWRTAASFLGKSRLNPFSHLSFSEACPWRWAAASPTRSHFCLPLFSCSFLAMTGPRRAPRSEPAGAGGAAVAAAVAWGWLLLDRHRLAAGCQIGSLVTLGAAGAVLSEQKNKNRSVYEIREK